MNTSSTWQCINCGEQHLESFETCWKCGSDAAGDRDPDFRIAESAPCQEQPPDVEFDGTQLPSLQLPAISYYIIPPYIWFSFIRTFNDLEHIMANDVPDFSPSLVELLGYSIVTLLVGVPVLFAIIRAMFLCITRGKNLANDLTGLLWMLSMFRLPESIRRSQPWFVPVYYGSIAAIVVVPCGFSIWRLIQLNRAGW